MQHINTSMKTFMDRFNPLVSNRFLVLLATTFASDIACAQTTLPLNKLDQCVDLIMVQEMVDSNSISGLCRLPRDRLERAIDEGARLKFIGGSYCLSNPPLVESLRGFSCVQTEYEGSRSLSCFRGLDESLIAEFKINYNRYREQTRAYLNAPSNCSISNTNAVFDPILAPPMPMVEVAKLELGFRLSIGPMSSRRRTIDHHFAVLDDSLGLTGPLGLEILTFGASSRTKPAVAESNSDRKTDSTTQTIGNLVLSISYQHDLSETLGRSIPKQVPVEAFGASIDFNKRPLSGGRWGTEKHLPFQAAEWISELASAEGLEEMSDQEMEMAIGMKSSDFATKISESTPFGIRNSRFLSFDTSLKFYMTESHSTCNGTGALGIGVITATPRQETLAIGSVAIYVMGVGHCGESSASARFMKSFREQVISTVIQRTSESAH
jgi:hypothetical protein